MNWSVSFMEEFFKSEVRQKFSQEFINKSDRPRLTNEEFIDRLKKSKHIFFQVEFDDVKMFISGYGNIFNINKVKRGIVKTTVDGIKGYRKIEIDFLKRWFDEYKLKIE